MRRTDWKAMEERPLTPKRSGLHSRCPRPSVSVIWGAVALIVVFLVLVLMWLYMPPLP